MFARYFVLPSVLLELVLAASNSSSIPESTSTIEITSFVTQTVSSPTSSSLSYANGTGLEYASSCNQEKLDWVENRGQTYVSNTTFTTSTDSLRYVTIDLRLVVNTTLQLTSCQLYCHQVWMDRDVRKHRGLYSLRWMASDERQHDIQDT